MLTYVGRQITSLWIQVCHWTIFYLLFCSLSMFGINPLKTTMFFLWNCTSWSDSLPLLATIQIVIPNKQYTYFLVKVCVVWVVFNISYKSPWKQSSIFLIISENRKCKLNMFLKNQTGQRFLYDSPCSLSAAHKKG